MSLAVARTKAAYPIRRNSKRTSCERTTCESLLYRTHSRSSERQNLRQRCARTLRIGAWTAAENICLQDENDGDTSLLSNAREYPNEVALDNANEDSHVPQGQVVRKVKTADNDRSKSKRVPWEDRMGGFRQDITVHQNFHAKLHATVFKNIMRREPLLRGMPVYDKTFDAVRSGRDLFIQTERSVRSLQYLLPVMQSILESGPLRRSRPQLLPRPSSLLVLCPTGGHAQDVQGMATRLIKGHKFGVGVMTLSVPSQRHSKDLRTKGFNVLMSTPENILQWLALPHAKSPLCEALQDLQTLVVDGKASSIRGGDFLQLLKAVMEDIPLQKKTQRVIISDEHDPQLDEQLTRLVLQDNYELHQEPQLEQIQETHWAREKEKKRDERAWRRKRLSFKNRGLKGPER